MNYGQSYLQLATRPTDSQGTSDRIPIETPQVSATGRARRDIQEVFGSLQAGTDKTRTIILKRRLSRTPSS